MPCAITKIDSNVTGLAFAEEECLKTLPGVAEADAIWYALEPNSYSDFGGDLKKVSRSPISQSRQNKKGVVSDLDASGGFNSDYTASNMLRLFQGFFFANVRQKPCTKPINGAQNVITGVTAADDKYALTSTGVAFNIPGLLVLASGFTNAANNGLKLVVSADTDDVTVTDGLVDETPTDAAFLQVVGYEFGTAEAGITKTGNIIQLTDSANALASLGLIVGEWIFIGGDTLADNRFANNIGYARIGAIAADGSSITFDDTTFAGATETSTGKEIRIFFGTVLRNEPTSDLIVRRSYNLERQLGEGETDTQAEYLIGAVANELTLNIPQADKLNVDLSFVACDTVYRSGESGDEIKAGTRIAAPGEDAYNTSSDVYRLKMSIVDATTTAPTALFGYVSEATVTIANNVTPNKAVGTLGAFETTAGNFEVGGSLTAYFTNTAAVQAIRDNSDVNFSIIVASGNAGSIFDIPLLGLGGGRLNVEKDAPITVPLEPAGAENSNGYTLLHVNFSYLPSIAMPT